MRFGRNEATRWSSSRRKRVQARAMCGNSRTKLRRGLLQRRAVSDRRCFGNETVDALIGTPINSADDLNAEDKVFFRKFRSLDPKDRERLRRMVDLWDDE